MEFRVLKRKLSLITYFARYKLGLILHSSMSRNGAAGRINSKILVAKQILEGFSAILFRRGFATFLHAEFVRAYQWWR